MAEKQAGITALITAYSRAYHATHDTPRIFDDFLAGQLYTEEERVTFDRNLASLLPMVDPDLAAAQPDPATALARVMQTQNGPVTLSRSRYCEDALEEAVRQGVQQYVILGAGFDTFAFRAAARRPDLLERLQVFEVDHPVTQALKRERIAVPGWRIPEQLHFVPVDFTQERLADALLRSPYDPREPAFFSWLGVTFYLTREVVFDTLRALAGVAQTGSRIVFDYMDADAFDPERGGRRVHLMQLIAGMVGEPMKAGFDPAQLPADLERAGLRLQENLDPEAIEARYFQGRADDYHAFEHVHFALAVVK